MESAIFSSLPVKLPVSNIFFNATDSHNHVGESVYFCSKKTVIAMKTTFTLEEVKALLALNPDQQRQIIDYGDKLAAASDEEIADSTVGDDAPEMIRDIHRRSVRRARAAVARRRRSLKAQAEAGNDERLSHSAERRLQWFRETVLPQIDREIRNSIDQARSAFSTLSPGQIAAVSRRAHNMLIKNLLQIMVPLYRPEL